ncbi:unnamed protein product [Moneuplotes crassus]|uniref:Uncharacterized protein n=1 Tax=Euplotes crassus TaxID=5936 RepID=A0AAD1XFF0_EUPCR|nr:unnamed protein product [Moneuplotes crassus]
MKSFHHFTFEYDQLFPQWDFTIDQAELLRFSEKYGTVECEIDDNDPQQKMLKCASLGNDACLKINEPEIGKSYCLRKTPKRRVQSFLGESSLKLRHTLDPSLFSSARGKYSQRKDIVLKSILRAIRRFYVNIFRARYPSLFICRVVYISESQIKEAVQEMCIELFTAEVKEKYHLNVFMQTLLDFKPPVYKEEHHVVIKRANQILKCCKSFSTNTFNKFCDDPCFRKICQKILISFEEEFLATLKNKEQNLERYKAVLCSFCE